MIISILELLPTHIVTSPFTSLCLFCNSVFELLLFSNWTSIKYWGVAINTSKVHINNMYIKYTFVHFAILLIRQILGVVLLPVTSPFAVEALSLRLRSRLGLRHLSINLLAVLLEVPFYPFALFLKLVVLSTINIWFFSWFLPSSISSPRRARESFSSSLAYYSSWRSSTNLVMVTREFCQSLSVGILTPSRVKWLWYPDILSMCSLTELFSSILQL